MALKTVDNQKTSNADECISNEIDILTTVGSHLNVVKLLGEKEQHFNSYKIFHRLNVNVKCT